MVQKSGIPQERWSRRAGFLKKMAQEQAQASRARPGAGPGFPCSTRSRQGFIDCPGAGRALLTVQEQAVLPSRCMSRRCCRHGAGRACGVPGWYRGSRCTPGGTGPGYSAQGTPLFPLAHAGSPCCHRWTHGGVRGGSWAQGRLWAWVTSSGREAWARTVGKKGRIPSGKDRAR